MKKDKRGSANKKRPIKGGRKYADKRSKPQSGKSRSAKSAASAKTVRAANGKARASVECVVGVLDCKGDRFGFIACDGGDVFVAGHNLGGARHGDTVRAEIVGESAGRDGVRKRDGRISEIIERNPLNIVATVVYENNCYCAVPDDRHYGELLEITSLGGASEHDKVIIVTEQRSGGDTAKVVAVLGRADDIGMDVLSVIASHNLRVDFPRDALEQAEAYGDSVDENEISASYRRDFRNDIVFTIDGSDSKDFDDAVSLARTDNGYRLGVYIADVSHYVTERSPLDREALLRGTSVYLADRVIPMLPETLSNGLCSLNEGVDRLALCCLINFDGDGNRLDSEVCEGVIRSKARLTYTGVQALLDGDEKLRTRYAPLVPMLELMKELALKRRKLRETRGSIEFKLTETEIKFDAKGRVKDICKKPALLSAGIIEEFMIAANCAVAEKFQRAKIPFVYRAHERPPAEKIQALNDYLDAVGINARCPLCPAPKQVADLLASADPSVSAAVSRVALRSMAKATYEPKNYGHFGLAEEFYCHFTSPIRRYPDLMIHRIIKAYLHGGGAAVKKYKDATFDVSVRSSKAERTAQDCERKVDDYKKAEYMSAHIGEKYTGVISSVTDFGFFVELDNSAEGLVHMATLPPAALFDKRRLCISCGMKRYRLGDAVDITVTGVQGDRIDFALA